MSFKLVRLTVVFALAFMAGCTCFSTKVVNNTNQPVFINIASEDEGQWAEQEGVLLNPRDRFKFPTYSLEYVRVRDLSGTTIAFEQVRDDSDTALDVMSLDSRLDAPPYGRISSRGNGPRWFICGDETDGVQLFGTTVTVTSQYAEPLVVSLIEDWDEPIEDREIKGVLLPAGGVADVYGLIVDRGWLRAVNARGELVYARLVPKRETSLASIPSRSLGVDEIQGGSFDC